MKIKGIILKQALQKLGIKQDEAAIKLGVSRPTLSVWCNKDELTDDVILAVKQKLDIDLTSDGALHQGDDVLRALIKSYEANEKLYKQLLAEKDERINELKERLSQYEGKSKTGTN